jgi:hypothetical protein
MGLEEGMELLLKGDGIGLEEGIEGAGRTKDRRFRGSSSVPKNDHLTFIDQICSLPLLQVELPSHKKVE